LFNFFVAFFFFFFPVVVLHGCHVFPLSVVPNVFVMGKTLGIGWFCTKKICFGGPQLCLFIFIIFS